MIRTNDHFPPLLFVSSCPGSFGLESASERGVQQNSLEIFLNVFRVQYCILQQFLAVPQWSARASICSNSIATHILSNSAPNGGKLFVWSVSPGTYVLRRFANVINCPGPCSLPELRFLSARRRIGRRTTLGGTVPAGWSALPMRRVLVQYSSP